MDGYRRRIVDAELKSALHIAGAVLIEGPRGCGKTETGRFLAASEVLLDTDENALMLAGIATQPQFSRAKHQGSSTSGS